MEYIVKLELGVVANSPLEAAEKAEEMYRDDFIRWTVEVVESGKAPSGKTFLVDLEVETVEER